MVRGGWNDADLDYLEQQVAARDAAAASVRRTVVALREQGCPWSVIAGALGMTKQAAWERYRHDESPTIGQQV